MQLTERETYIVNNIARKTCYKWSGASFEDIVSMLHLELYEKWDDVLRYREETEGEGSLVLWLSRAANLEAKDEQKHYNRQELSAGFTYSVEQIENCIAEGIVFEGYEAPIGASEVLPIIIDMKEAYNALGKVDKDIIMLRYKFGVDVKDIATDFDVQPTTIYKRLTRAFEKMQIILG